MFLLLGGLSLVVGALGIANITLVGVMERTAEIGLRRAIGATRRHIAHSSSFESASMGYCGGLLGSSVGVLIVVGRLGVSGLDPGARPARSLARASRGRRDRSAVRSLSRLARRRARAGRSVSDTSSELKWIIFVISNTKKLFKPSLLGQMGGM
jgi:ABC-type antimicrobial peptide transport system permease subunit